MNQDELDHARILALEDQVRAAIGDEGCYRLGTELLAIAERGNTASIRVLRDMVQVIEHPPDWEPPEGSEGYYV